MEASPSSPPPWRAWLNRLTTRQKQLLAAAGGAVVVLVIVLAARGGDGGGPDVQRLERGTVLITSVDETGSSTGIGSGTIISRDGLILTNAHVAAPATPGQGLAAGTTNDRKDPAALVVGVFKSEDEPVDNRYIAEVQSVDGYLDVAVIRVTKTVDGEEVDPGDLNLPAVPLGDSNDLENGQDITIVGFPGIGGGFEGAIDVIQGNVAGFERDERIEDRRGWIKTDAEISGGNSGGLAADGDGRIVGIPTVVNFDLDSATSKGKLRPIRLAMPLIEAAREGTGRDYTSPYFVPGTGAEKATVTGWTAAPPGAGCSFQPVSQYASGTSSITAVLEFEGMRKGVDLRYLWVHYESAEDKEPELVGRIADVWRSGAARSSCLGLGFPGQGGPKVEDGIYALLILAGPNLESIGGAEIAVGGSGSTSTDTTPPTTNQGGGDCRNWNPQQFIKTAVQLQAGNLSNGQVAAEGGLFSLTERIGEYGTAAEADQAAASRIDDLPGHNDIRWLVIQSGGRFHAYVAKLYEAVFITSSGPIESPQLEITPNLDPPPCFIPPAQGTVVRWHAMNFLSDTVQYIRFDWSSEAAPQASVFTP